MSASADLYLGVDGGGTGCRCRLETAAGEVLGSGIAGPASLRLGPKADALPRIEFVEALQPTSEIEYSGHDP